MKESIADFLIPVVDHDKASAGPATYVPLDPDAKERLVIQNDVPATSFRVPGVGTLGSREIQERSEIMIGEPLRDRRQLYLQVERSN